MDISSLIERTIKTVGSIPMRGSLKHNDLLFIIDKTHKLLCFKFSDISLDLKF